MIRQFLGFLWVFTTLVSAQADLRPTLETTYGAWREAMIRRDPAAWQRVTAEHRRIEVRNRIVSERLPFPAAAFDLPAAPPSLAGLTFLEVKQKGPTAKSFYFGKIDFAVDAEPTENLLVLSFVKGSAGWLYDRADYVNLMALPAVRKELAAGDLKYLKEVPEALPSGVIPPTPISAPVAKWVAKVYVFCPGREVQVQINKISRHRFANAKEAEVVIGGALDGPNEVQYSVKKLEGSTGKEVMTIRVYLMSQIPGDNPVKAFEYQIAAGQTPKSAATGTFVVDSSLTAQLTGK